MKPLEFIGKVESNMGKFHKDMVVPGRKSLAMAPHDWPDQLAPGTLNVKIDDRGFPNDIGKLGRNVGIKKFDEGYFTPAFVIPQQDIIGNTLRPKDSQPNRGTAQVWRSELRNLTTDEAVTCWMLRRIGSSISTQIELVSEYQLRDRLKLANGTPVKVTVFEG